MRHTSLETGDVAPQRSPVAMDRTVLQGTVRLLSPAAFQSRVFQAQEDAALWTRAWVCVGFAAEIPNPGDVLPFTVGNHGIHIERLADGSLAGRFNKAQHGGCRAVPAQCQTGAKTKCSFTACGYSRDRRPIAADDATRDVVLDQYFGLRPERLLTVAVKVWGPLLLVQLDPELKPTFAWPESAAIFGTARIAERGGSIDTRWIEYAANWKNLAVSFAEGTVVSWAPSHALIDDPSPTALLFPNVVIIEHDALTAAIVLQPTALGRTLCRIRLFGRDGDASQDETAQQDLLAAVAARAAAAEALQHDHTATTPGDPDVRAWFEGEVLRAIDALHDETQTHTLYQTQDNGGW